MPARPGLLTLSFLRSRLSLSAVSFFLLSSSPTSFPPFSDMVDEADQRLFHSIRYNPHHVLHELLPPISVASQNYEVRARAHNREIPCRAGSLSDSNFITRMIYNDCYWFTFLYLLLLLLFYVLYLDIFYV